MTRAEFLNSFKVKFKNTIKDFVDKSQYRVYIEIDPKDIKEVVEYLFVDSEARFIIASGMDARFHFEILYHFNIEEIRLLISIRVKLNRDNPRIESIASIIKGAEWIEREMHELIGIDFPGNPNLERLLLPDEWPKGVYPLRTDYKEWDKDAIRDRGV
ncbi:NADH-quinone oxidoreductase subunit C [Candidatus Omnitrophota bacterium]